MFEYLLKVRSKKEVEALVNGGQPFVYTSGKYPSQYHKTTVVGSLGPHPGKQGALVYDLRRDPEAYVHMSPAELAAAWRDRSEDETKRFPVKTLQYNRCPAVAPLGVLDDQAKQHISLDMESVHKNSKILENHPAFYKNLLAALKIMDTQQQSQLLANEQEVDAALYDGFFDDQDKTAMSVVRAAGADEIGSLTMQFKDERLNKLLPLYKARNFKKTLSTEERDAWETFRTQRLLGGGERSLATRYFARLTEIAARKGLSAEDRYLLEELQLYGESILPAPEA